MPHLRSCPPLSTISTGHSLLATRYYHCIFLPILLNKFLYIDHWSLVTGHLYLIPIRPHAITNRSVKSWIGQDHVNPRKYLLIKSIKSILVPPKNPIYFRGLHSIGPLPNFVSRIFEAGAQIKTSRCHFEQHSDLYSNMLGQELDTTILTSLTPFPSVRPSVSQSIHQTVHVSYCPSVRLSIHQSISLSVHPSIIPTVHHYLHQFVPPSVRPSVHQSVHHSIYSSIHVSITLPVHHYVRP